MNSKKLISAKNIQIFRNDKLLKHSSKIKKKSPLFKTIHSLLCKKQEVDQTLRKIFLKYYLKYFNSMDTT